MCCLSRMQPPRQFQGDGRPNAPPPLPAFVLPKKKKVHGVPVFLEDQHGASTPPFPQPLPAGGKKRRQAGITGCVSWPMGPQGHGEPPHPRTHWPAPRMTKPVDILNFHAYPITGRAERRLSWGGKLRKHLQGAAEAAAPPSTRV